MTYRRIMKCAAIGILSIIISPVFGFETPGNAESVAEMQREQAERRREEADRQRREEAERERRERAEEAARERRAEAERERREELQRQRAEEATRARAEAEQQRREQAARERAAEQQRERGMERQRQDRLREEQQRAAREQEERQREARAQAERAAQTRAMQERETRLREEQRRAAQEQEMRQRESRIQAERAAQARDQEARQRALRNDKPTPRQIVVPQPVAPATAPSPVRASVKYQSPPAAANPHERVPLPWAVKGSGPNVVVVMPPSPSLSSDPVQDELIADVGNIQPGGRYNECVNYFYDQKNFDTLTIRNDCGEAVHWANRSGSGDILPGRQAGTGDSRRVVAERPSILDITLCPMGFNPIGADGHYWSGGAYRCKYDANAAQSTSYGRVPAAAGSSSAVGIRSAVPPSPPPSDSIPEPPTIYQPGGEFNNCVSFGYDPNNYNWYTIKNGCGEAIHWVTTTNMAGDTAPGRKGGTGESSDEVARHPGWEWAICRAGYVPYDAEGRFWTGGMYRCGPR